MFSLLFGKNGVSLELKTKQSDFCCNKAREMRRFYQIYIIFLVPVPYWIRIRLVFTWIQIRIKAWSGSGSEICFFRSWIGFGFDWTILTDLPVCSARNCTLAVLPTPVSPTSRTGSPPSTALATPSSSTAECLQNNHHQEKGLWTLRKLSIYTVFYFNFIEKTKTDLRFCAFSRSRGKQFLKA